MLYLKQSTASQSVVIGPFVDSTDGATAETGLTIANTDIRLAKNGANIVAKNSGGGTHDEGGFYTITLDATDTDTVGRLQLYVTVAGALTVYHEFQVLEEAVYDALFGAGAAGYQVPIWSSASATVNLSNTTVATLTTNSDKAGYSISGTLTTLDALDTAQDAQHSTTQSAISALNDPTAAAIADAVLDEALSGHTTAGSLGKAIADIETDATAILADTGTDGVVVASIAANAVNASALAADAVTEIQSGLATAAALATVDNEIAVIDGIVDDLKSGIIYGAAATGTLSTTQASTNLAGYADDQLIGRTVIWLSGNCEGEASDITDYANTNGVLTFTALTTAPGNGDTFKIV